MVCFFLYSITDLTGQENPGFSFDKGVGIVAPDSSVSLHFQFNMQNRIEMKTRSANDWTINEFAAKIKRFRVKFSGFMVDPRLTYQIELALAPQSVNGAAVGQAPSVMYDAMISYQMSKRFKLEFGQTVLPGNRDRINSSSSLQLVDRSLANSVFNMDLDFGFQGEYQFNPGARYPLVFQGAITTGEGKNWVVEVHPGFSYTGRLDWYPLGSFLNNSAYKEGDLEWHLQPRLMTGISYNFNDQAIRADGQRGDLLYGSRDISTVFADFIFKFQGWAMQGTYISRNSNDPVTFDSRGPGIRYVYKGDGFNVQLSKYFRSDWEVVSRLSGVTPGEEIHDLTSQRRDWTVGINRYIKSRSIKLQADATLHQTRPMDSDYTGRYGFRFQAQVGF